ncbi:hypothetical protein A2415_04125 [candidate division WWE3 bacterium RIFOXYC1_FULL_39_7]|uniref:DNA-binding response regulator n=2 Tax=Katanobacteria TaxID=422282 RepID=A0A1F4X7I0_UNCKA|nr:MAG: hypothetical protein A2415_04125 [candidate division WWE3 bacterium RIFOXYC1_FULL_39_7]OGC77670.1 MAG: hypothetical protein A2619_05375 [candidate division WWE3 bacterium RIFOXYD1_FULL_39_9]
MRILLIEDKAEYLDTFITEIEKQYVVDVAYNTIEGSYLSSVNDYDVIVVDTGLPDVDPVSLCKDARSSKIESPILLLADKTNFEYKVESLEAGADALMYKPINVKELSAQVGALIRRSNKLSTQTIDVKNFKLDLCNKSVFYLGQPISLRRKEYDILEYLVVNINKTVSKEKLLEHVWSEGIYMESNTLEVHVRNLRLVLKRFYAEELIVTLRGYGYRIES